MKLNPLNSILYSDPYQEKVVLRAITNFSTMKNKSNLLRNHHKVSDSISATQKVSFVYKTKDLPQLYEPEMSDIFLFRMQECHLEL